MIVGETRTLQHQEAAASAFTVTSPTLVVTKPDGTNESPITPTVSPGGATTPQTLIASYTPASAGKYVMTWGLTVGAQVLKRPEIYFASWTDAAALIRRRTQKSVTDLPDATIDPELWYTVRTLIDRFPTLQTAGGYATLAGADQDRFDEAAGLLTAARLRAFLPKTVLTGDVQEIEIQNQTRERYQPVAPSVPLEKQWIEEAILALGRVTLIQQAYAAAAGNFSPFVVSGPTRTSLGLGNIETLVASDVRLLTDQWAISSDDGINDIDNS